MGILPVAPKVQKKCKCGKDFASQDGNETLCNLCLHDKKWEERAAPESIVGGKIVRVCKYKPCSKQFEVFVGAQVRKIFCCTHCQCLQSRADQKRYGKRRQ